MCMHRPILQSLQAQERNNILAYHRLLEKESLCEVQIYNMEEAEKPVISIMS